jgi:hypothetical protein
MDQINAINWTLTKTRPNFKRKHSSDISNIWKKGFEISQDEKKMVIDVFSNLNTTMCHVDQSLMLNSQDMVEDQ